MKHIKAITTCLFCLSFFAIGHTQQQIPTEQKVFLGQDQKLYVNKNLGVYFWLSTSPEENSVKHRLKSDSSKKYSNPMFLDTEGYNTLRSPSAVDHKTKRTAYPIRDIVFEVYADGIAPKTSHKALYNKTIYRSSKLYYSGNNILISLKSTDSESGVAQKYYSINGENYLEYTDSILILNDGEKKLKYYSTDKVGNIEQAKETIFYVDNTAPKTSYTIEGKQKKIKLSSEDNLVGIKSIYYTINDGSKQLYKKPITTKQLSSQDKISFYAIDYLNNTEQIQVIEGSVFLSQTSE